MVAHQTLTLRAEVRYLSPVPYKNTLVISEWFINRGSVGPSVGASNVFLYGNNLESNAAGMVRRPALKTGFSEMGWGSTPLLSANL